MGKSFIDPNNPGNWNIFKVKKRGGGWRIIEEPKPALMEQYKKLFDELMRSNVIRNRLFCPFSHGFVPGRSIATNAQPHVGKKYVAAIDIKDFFGSISVDKLYGLYPQVGTEIADIARSIVKRPYLEHVKETLTNTVFKTREKNGEVVTYLPQGAPTSPIIANLYMSRFDWKFGMTCAKHDIAYTRYADNITISGDDPQKLREMLKYGLGLIKHDMQLRVKYVRVMPYWKKQKVCGVVVNSKLNVDREYRRRVRAMLHQINQKSEEEKRKILGMAAYIHSVRRLNEANPEDLPISNAEYYALKRAEKALNKM
jgi:Mor family transcriptional regulator